MKRLIALLFACLVAAHSSATTYYVSPTGNAGNSGLSPSAPLPLGSGLNSKVLSGNLFIALDGYYDASQQPGGIFKIWNTGMQSAASPCTFQAQHKWAAIIAGGTGGGIQSGSSTGYQTPMIVFDGFQVCSNTGEGISLCSNSVVRNCWVHDNTQEGIIWGNYGGANLVEYTLMERNGTDSGFPYHYHNLYSYGPNNTIRYNVSRLAVYGHGIQVYSEQDLVVGSVTNNRIYGNLVYSNAVSAPSGIKYGTDIYGAIVDTSNGNAPKFPGTNYAWNNAFLDGIYTSAGGSPDHGTLYFTNNIVLPPAPGQPLFDGNGPTGVIGDYNAVTNSGGSGITGSTHELVTTWAAIGFANVPKGLYWLTSGSSLRGAALANIHGTNDWFNNTLSTDPDIGPVQYILAQAADTRTLDPSVLPTTGAPYWTPLAADPTITVQPQSQTVGQGVGATFSVTAGGTGPFSYAWTKNGGAVGSNASTYTTPNADCSLNGAIYAVAVTGANGTVNSANAVLTVSGCVGTNASTVITLQIGSGVKLIIGNGVQWSIGSQ